MLTRQERQEIAERAKACKKEEELNWDQFSYVLLGIQSWRNDEELLDRIVELCNVSNVDELHFKSSADDLYLRALEIKHERVADDVRIKGSWDWIPIHDCEKEFNEAMAHYKHLIEKEQQC